jgi:hypothetical protein
MLRRRRFAAVGIVGILAVLTGVLAWPIAWEQLETGACRVHQRSVTRELAVWAEEYGKVRNRQEAERAVDMLEYVRHYYVPGPGYRSDPMTEATLEEQRKQTVGAIVAGLREFTGENFGTNSERWRARIKRGRSGTSATRTK